MSKSHKAGKPRSLKPEEVREIRAWYRRYSTTPVRKEMARKYGVAMTTLMNAAAGRTYKDVQP